MAPPRSVTREEREARAQRQWQKYKESRRLRFKFLTERVGHLSPSIQEIYDSAGKEPQLETHLPFPHEKEIKSQADSGNRSDHWFASTNQLGEASPGGTIGLLGMLATADVGDKFIKRCFDDARQDSAWLYKDHFEGHARDYPPWTSRKSDASVKLQRLHIMVDALANDRDSPLIWKLLNSMFRLNGYLMKILRFIDEKNASLGGQPALPDGSNIKDQSLKASWVLHRAWIRLLHYRSLSFGSQARGIDQLREILVIARAQLEEELRRAPPGSRKIFEGLVQFETTLESLNSFLETLAAEFGNYSAPKLGARRPYTASDFNIDADRVGASWNRITQPRRPDPLGNIVKPLGPMLLWSQLLDRATDFEDDNNSYYVEDHPFENRVIAEDEHWESAKIMPSTNYSAEYAKHRMPDAAKQDYVQALAKKVSQVNFNRRNFLALRDWSKKRPWKQLYWVFDTVTTDTWRDQITDFYNTIERLKIVAIDVTGNDDAASAFQTQISDPESEPNLFANVFPIHPIPSHDPQRYVGPYFRNCTHCRQDYQPGELWLRFFCDHFMHFECAREIWDNLGNPDFQCSLCMKLQSGQLHDVAGIVPEVIDLWDNIDLVSTKEVAGGGIGEGLWPDQEGFREPYWESEAAHLDYSETWDIGEPRSLHNKMAQMRNVRRKRVLQNREKRLEEDKAYATLAE